MRVVTAGRLTTLQDRGRIGLAHLGVPRAGALDRPAAALANRLVGNDAGDAVLEVVLGGLEVESDTGVWVAVTGAQGPVLVDAHPVAHGRPVRLAAGSRLVLGTPATGARSYLAVGGGIVVDPVLGSRSTDTLSWVGPRRVGDGDELPVGVPRSAPAFVDLSRLPRPGPLGLSPGPRADWFASGVLESMTAARWTVAADSDRIGLRLSGPVIDRARDGELASEGMVLGAIQVPPDGQPVVFLADHPPTGGYPVVAVVDDRDLWQCGQLRPGEEVRFALTR